MTLILGKEDDKMLKVRSRLTFL